MRSIILGATASALLFACSSTGGSESAQGSASWDAPAIASGSRLRAKVLNGGGARQLVAFVDTARGNEECTFQEVVGGRMLCLPAAITAGNLSGQFADAACSQSALQVASCAADAKYIALTTSTGCGGNVISEIRPVTGVATQLFFGGPASCNPGPGTAGAGLSFVALGDRIPLDQFVEATITTEVRDGLAQRIAVSPDGARQLVGYRDAALDLDCTFQVMADGVTRCLPRAGTGQIIYSDSDCTLPVGALSVNTNSCESGAMARELDPATGCVRAFYSVGPGTSSIDIENGYVGSTNPSSTSCSTSFRPQSAIPLNNITGSLPKLARISGGSGRLVPALVSGTAADALVLGWHDVEKNVDCAFVKASDGKIRCLPNGGPGLVFWTDTACKAPTRLAALTGERGCVPSGARFARATEATCTVSAAGASPIERTTRVFALSGEPRTVGPSSVETSPGRCVTVAGVVGAIDATEVNPADYVEATIATE